MSKLVNYKLQTQIETLKNDTSKESFKDYILSILRDEQKTHYQKADYIGLSLNELKNKIDFISQDVKELQAIKKQYTESLDIAKITIAEVFTSDNIYRIDGNLISSLTLSKPTTKTKETLEVIDEKKVMNLGYVKFEPDIEAIKIAMQTRTGKEELKEYVSMDIEEINTPAKVKINSKRKSDNLLIETDEILDINIIT